MSDNKDKKDTEAKSLIEVKKPIAEDGGGGDKAKPPRVSLFEYYFMFVS